MPSVPGDVQGFVERCVALTGFSEFDLHATGMAGLYLKTARERVGHDRFEEFLAALAEKKGAWLHPDDLTPTDREIARAVVYLWYTGAWPSLAKAVHTELWGKADHSEESAEPRPDQPGKADQAEQGADLHPEQRGKARTTSPAKPDNTEFVVSASSYVEGLVWHTFNGHPVGARPPGFGTWSVAPIEPPSLDQIKRECGLTTKSEPTGSEVDTGVESTEPEAVEPEAAALARLRRPGPQIARHVPPSAVPQDRERQQEVDPA